MVLSFMILSIKSLDRCMDASLYQERTNTLKDSVNLGPSADEGNNCTKPYSDLGQILAITTG